MNVAHSLGPMNIVYDALSMDGEDLQECHSLNTMLMNYRSVVVYSLLSFTPVDYVKSSVLMLRSVLKLIVSILHALIKLNYVLIAKWTSRYNWSRG